MPKVKERYDETWVEERDDESYFVKTKPRKGVKPR